MRYTTPDIFNPESLAALRALVHDSHKVAITCHVSPDGDAIGSSLALRLMLEEMGKAAFVVTPDRPPRALSFLPGIDSVVSHSCRPTTAVNIIKSASLVICLDFNAAKRLDKLAPAVLEAEAPKVMIDHHLDPEHFCEVTISRPEMSSTCELLYRVAEHAGWLRYMGVDAASCLYTGMMTDTGNFTYNCADPVINIIVADLMQKGIDRMRLYKEACNTFSADCLRLRGYAVSEKMQIFPEHKAALITLTADELQRFNYVKGDTEGIVNIPLAVPEVVYSVFLREDLEKGQVKVSMRSTGDFPVNRLCEDYFNGGGHRNAAGGEMPLPLDAVVATFIASLPDNDKYL